jgi:hypothetical protein
MEGVDNQEVVVAKERDILQLALKVGLMTKKAASMLKRNLWMKELETRPISGAMPLQNRQQLIRQ